MSIIPFSGLMRRAGSAELDEITAAVRKTIMEIAPEKCGIMIVRELNVTINYAAGGGAKVNISAESE